MLSPLVHSLSLPVADLPPPLPQPPSSPAPVRYPDLLHQPDLVRCPGAAEELDPVPEDEDPTRDRPAHGPGLIRTSDELERLVDALLNTPSEPTYPGGDREFTSPDGAAAIRSARDTAIAHGCAVVLVREVDDERELLVMAGESGFYMESAYV